MIFGPYINISISITFFWSCEEGDFRKLAVSLIVETGDLRTVTIFTDVLTSVCVPAPHLDHVLGAGPQRVQLRLAVPHPAGQLGRGHIHLAPVLSINCLESRIMDKRLIILKMSN